MAKPTKEIREEDGTLVITEKDAPAGMGAIYPEDLSECQGFPELIEIEEAKKIYGEHNEGCACETCIRVEKWYKNNSEATCCMPEFMREMGFGN